MPLALIVWTEQLSEHIMLKHAQIFLHAQADHANLVALLDLCLGLILTSRTCKIPNI